MLVGEDPSSATYVRMKQRRCARHGLESRAVTLSASAPTAEVVSAVRRLDADPSVDGILVQHPAPSQVDERAVLGGTGHRSCTPEGIIRLLDAYDVELSGRHVVVVGRSHILGLPVGMLMLRRNATVTYCHSRTTDLARHVSDADVVVAAVGRPELVRAAWIAPGAVVVDAGYHPGNVGDVEPGAGDRASLITPVPGGVGPMTIAVLLAQTVDAAEQLL